jgi:hypothetical protein
MEEDDQALLADETTDPKLWLMSWPIQSRKKYLSTF